MKSNQTVNPRGIPGRKHLTIFLALILAVALAALLTMTATGTGVITRVSTDSAGNQSTGWETSGMGFSLSADGRYVAFDSWTANLVPGDTNNLSDVFVKDTLTGVTARVSTNSAGEEAYGQAPAISDDGRFVTFTSRAKNLVAEDPYDDGDLFVKDTQTGETTLASVTQYGVDGSANAGSSISADGRYVTFASYSGFHGSFGGDGGLRAYVKDRLTGQLMLVPGVYGASLSADGQYAVGDDQYKVIRTNIQTGEQSVVSTNQAGVQATSYNGQGSLSADGRYVLFYSAASNLLPGVSGSQLYVKDTLTGSVALASADAAGVSGNHFPGSHSISHDGRYVAFSSLATNLVPGVDDGVNEVYLKDMQTGAISLVSTDLAGVRANSYSPYGSGSSFSGGSAISGDARYVAFDSQADNLVPSDTNGHDDIFLAATSVCTGGAKPALIISQSGAYWASYADFTARELTVMVNVANQGVASAYAVAIAGSNNTNGVTLVTGTPLNLGYLSGGSVAGRELKYHVPSGVASFRISLLGGAADACGTTYMYP